MSDPLATPKIRTLEGAHAWRESCRAQDLRWVLTNGCFDLLHPGHLTFLRDARALGDVLCVCLNADASVRALKGPQRPILDERSRAFALAALEWVDGVVLFQTPRLDREIRALQPDVYAKAGDYDLDRLDPAEHAALRETGAQIRFLPFLEGFSTTALIARIHSAQTAEGAAR